MRVLTIIKQIARQPSTWFGVAILFAKPIWRIIGVIGDLTFVAESTPAIMGAAEAAGQFLSTGMGTVVLALTGLSVMAYSAYSAAASLPGPAKVIPPPKHDKYTPNKTANEQPRPAQASTTQVYFDDIDGIDIFTVAQASCYWCEVAPGISHLYQKGNNPKIGAVEQMIISEYRSGNLTLDSANNTLATIGDYSNSYVTRDDLVALATRKKLKPKFLFPEER